MREKIVGASSEHKHFSIRTQTRRVPQSAENTATSASPRHYKHRSEVRRTWAAPCARVWAASTGSCWRSTARRRLWNRHVNEACVRSDEVRLVCVTHSVFVCRSWSLRTERCDPLTPEWRSATSVRTDRAEERSWNTHKLHWPFTELSDTPFPPRQFQCWFRARA